MNIAKHFALCVVIGVVGCGPAKAPLPKEPPPAEKAKMHDQHAEKSAAEPAK